MTYLPDHLSTEVVRAIARAPDPLEAIRAATADGAAIGDVVRALAREAWWCRVLAMLTAYRVRTHALGFTRDGDPRHPLFVPGDARLEAAP